MIYLKDIFIYPIKSCKGQRVESAGLDEYGIVGDRRFMVVDEFGNFLTAREHHRMVLIAPRIEKDVLTLQSPNSETVIPMSSFGEERVTVKVWDDPCEALDCGEEAAKWFSKELSIRCRLVRMGRKFSRPVKPQYAVKSDHTTFSDAFPMLLISTASLDDLNSRLPAPLTMNRFRPNLVVTGCEAYAEDRWKDFRIGNVNLRVVKPCSRCVLTTVDPETAEAGPEPLKTLSGYRRKDDGKVYFGENVIHTDKSGLLQINRTLNILTD